MSDHNPIDPTTQPRQQDPHHPCCANTVAKKISIGALVVGLPLATFAVYKALENADQPGNLIPGKPLELDAALRHVDPSLIKYKELARIETGFAKPAAITVDPKGNLLVGADGMVRIFSRSGSQIADLPVPGRVYCLAAAEPDLLYVGIKDHVEVYAIDGKLIKRWPSYGDNAFLTCITPSGDNVWVADAGRRLLLRCDRDGNVLAEIGKGDPKKGLSPFNLPSPHLDVAVDPAGLVWVNNMGLHRLEGYRPDGTLSKFWGKAGARIEAFPGCCNPADFAVLKDGSFIVAEKMTPRVKKYSPDGAFQGVVVPPDVFGQNMMGIDLAIDPDERVFLMERGKREVRIFVPLEEGQK